MFIEDYDINVGRHLVQGVDVWLNNPRRPLEASGTSGQKVVLNGGLNLSVLDGWWAEAYDGLNGFAIGDGRDAHVDRRPRRARRARRCCDVLRDEVVPLYYDRDRDGLPRDWIARMKRAIRTLGWRFSADRMVMDYVLRCYIPAAGGTSTDMRRSEFLPPLRSGSPTTPESSLTTPESSDHSGVAAGFWPRLLNSRPPLRSRSSRTPESFRDFSHRRPAAA